MYVCFRGAVRASPAKKGVLAFGKAVRGKREAAFELNKSAFPFPVGKRSRATSEKMEH